MMIKKFLKSIIVRLKRLLFNTDVFYISGPETLPEPLSRAQEDKLLERLAAGDKTAKEQLIVHNLRLVVYIAKKFDNSGVGIDDLISIGTIGLIKAVSTFNSDKGIHLATYAARCIENEILMYFRNQKKTAQDVFISDPIDTDKDGNALTLIDIIADTSDIAEEIDTKMGLEKLKVIISGCLDERERRIIEMRYGLGGREELTQRDIAKKLGISRSYVSRIEKSALEKLRKQF